MDIITDKNNTFSLFAPIEFEKGKDVDGKPGKMKMGGIASTSSKDADGEFLDPKGFELDYFKKYGFMNWNHQSSKDPSTVIGRPTKASVTKEGQLYVACELFEKSKKAKQVYELAEVLKAEGYNLGYSIEGKVIERDPNNPKIVKKAKITGCAITPNPKNRDSVAEIIKGLSSDDFGFTKGESYDEDIFDILEDEGDELLKKATALFEKSVEADGSGEDLKKESLDKDTKNLEFNKKKDKKKLVKGQVFKILSLDLPYLTQKSLDNIFNLAEKIDKSGLMKAQVTEEALEKALETLGINNGTSEETSETDTDTETSTSTEESASSEDLEKSLNDKLKEIEEIEKGLIEKGMYKGDDGKMYKSKEDYEKSKVKKGGKDLSQNASGYAEEQTVLKAVTPEAIEAAKVVLSSAGISIEEEVVVKGEEAEELVESSTDSVVDLVKGLVGDLTETVDSKTTALGTLIKGFQDEVEELRSNIEIIGSRSQGPKSLQKASEVKHTERFAKGEGAEELEGKVLSVSKNRPQVLETLSKGYMNEEGDAIVDQKLANATLSYEQGKVVNDIMKSFFAKEGITLVA